MLNWFPFPLPSFLPRTPTPIAHMEQQSFEESIRGRRRKNKELLNCIVCENILVIYYVVFKTETVIFRDERTQESHDEAIHSDTE